MATDARAEILARVCAATGRATIIADGSTTGLNVADSRLAAEEWISLPRDYRRTAARGHGELLPLFVDRLRDYDAHVVETQSGQVAGTVADLLRARGNPRIVIPSGLKAHYLPQGFDFVVDAGMTAAELDACEGVLTEATLGIAETGTIVLQNVAGQGRRAITLLPDYYVCLLDARSVVATVPEAMARLGPTAALATTFISGPSATADIEMIRIKGVHGPRFLDVVLFQ